jgi:hypothetical protein
MSDEVYWFTSISSAPANYDSTVRTKRKPLFAGLSEEERRVLRSHNSSKKAQEALEKRLLTRLVTRESKPISPTQRPSAWKSTSMVNVADGTH